MSAITFEIRVEGVVDEDSLADLGDVSVTTMAATTVLTGAAADQAALLGVLSRLRAHGLVVTEMHRLPAAAPDAESSGADTA
jgi:hypothetical protein